MIVVPERVIFDLSSCTPAFDVLFDAAGLSIAEVSEQLTELSKVIYQDGTEAAICRFISEYVNHLNFTKDQFGRLMLGLGEYISPFIYNIGSSIKILIDAYKLRDSRYYLNYCELTNNYKLIVYFSKGK